MRNFDTKFQVMPLSERLRIHYLLDQTFGVWTSQQKPKRVKLFRYKQDKLIEKPQPVLSVFNKKYVNVRQLLDILKIGATAFWKWKSEGRLEDYDLVKYKGLWYINKEHVQEFIKLVLKKQVNFYWKKVKEDKNGRES